MTNNLPNILALDFDGVICDGLIEYFQIAWRSYCQIWKPAETKPDPDLALSFYRVRPAIESGWEMPLLIRALLTGITQEQILREWPEIVPHLLTENNLKAQSVGAMLDGLRDNWIAEDLPGWLSLHRFYPGIADRLQSLQESAVKVAIVTTKEGRFVRELLQLAGVQIPSELIFGKEYNKPKHQILREFLAASGKDATIWFVEDRLKTLLSVKQQPDLSQVRLFLADWGYNTLAERESMAQNPPVQLLSLSQFAGDFGDWLPD
ncbi:haloacid dehalogenase [filamentous cyanobacterium Phorm 46]|nr:haloacid dehalogenase [filamentous cyanobacterium Phorm 46]PSB54044.1 haloacid dehalogenase [filamentous cyanobacterium Phorm 6]